MVVDHSNYTNEISEMMNMHHLVAQKITRSEKSWHINEEIIKKENAFIIKVMLDQKVISYSLFFYNKQESIYFSSCTERKYFKYYKNITHTSIFEAIKYLKKNNCENFTLGETKSIFSTRNISDKEKNINLFKNHFGGDLEVNIFFDCFTSQLKDLYFD